MPKYPWKVSYTKAGVRGIASEGASSRRDAADVYVIGELPDNQSAAALSLAANISEGLAAETVVLMPPEEFDVATKKEVSFRPPGD